MGGKLFSQALCLCGILNPSACCLFIFKHPSKNDLAHVTCNKASVSRIFWFALLRRSQLLRMGLGTFTMADQNTWFWGFADIMVIVMRIIMYIKLDKISYLGMTVLF